MAKKITIPYNGKTYTLTYTRSTVRMMEKQGFKINELTDMPATMIPLLFHGAFLANHPNTKGDTKEAIFDSLGNRSKLVEVLVEMYADTYNTLFDNGDEDADEGNSGWAVAE